jgi:hypothetical protein
LSEFLSLTSAISLEKHNFDETLVENILIIMENIKTPLCKYIEQTTTTVDILKTEKSYSYEKWNIYSELRELHFNHTQRYHKRTKVIEVIFNLK